MGQYTDERLLLHEVRNHAEFREKLARLKLTSDFGAWDVAVSNVVKGWLLLARQHAEELAGMNPHQQPRAVYSRAYYVAYNASKAVRYASRGWVSLGGEDHRKVSDLPDSFPNVDAWARDLQVMYAHRLRADYDNWADTPAERTLQPVNCAELSKSFLEACESFLKDNYGIEM